jgi:hypothetical protein
MPITPQCNKANRHTGRPKGSKGIKKILKERYNSSEEYVLKICDIMDLFNSILLKSRKSILQLEQNNEITFLEDNFIKDIKNSNKLIDYLKLLCQLDTRGESKEVIINVIQSKHEIIDFDDNTRAV